MNTTQLSTCILAVWSLTTAPLVFAADDHKGHAHDAKSVAPHPHQAKPLYGGVVAVAKDINYELVARSSSLVLYITDHDQPVDTEKSSATLTMLSGTEKSDVKLSPAGKNMLKADGTFKVAAGTKVIAIVKIGDKAPESMRFVLK